MARAPQLRLRTQFFLVVLLLVGIAGAAITAFFVRMHQAALADVTEKKVAMIRADLGDKAATLARNGAVSSARSAVMMDFTLLQNVIGATVQADRSIKSALIADASGKIVVHSDPSKVGRRVTGDALPNAGKDLTVREVVDDNGVPSLEAIAPIHVGGDVWGSVRYTVSLIPCLIATENSKTEQSAVARRAIIFAGGVGLVLLLISVVATALAAKPVVRPVSLLEDAVQRVLAGQQNVHVDIENPPDIARVGRTFNDMIEAIGNRTKLLRQDRRRVEIALEEAQQISKTKEVFLARVWQDLLNPLQRIEQDGQTMLKSFSGTEGLVCASCKTAFEAADGTAAVGKPCPRCGGKLGKSTVMQLVGDAEVVQKSLRDVETRGTELRRLVGEILEFSALEADQKKLNLEQLEVPKLIEAAKVSMTVMAEGKKLIWPTKPPAVGLEGDRIRIEQGVTLAVELVCQISPQPSDVRLEVDEVTYHGEPGIQFVVRDAGSGFAKEFLDALRSGAGPDARATLSMMALRRVADLHHGELSIESDVGRGVTVRLILPRGQPQVQPRPAPRRRQAEGTAS
ncbi:MAG: ATP-binding protein [Myxococcota bacterium]|nr:ATP-binding protein [Myxococcota bacterium]